jgi:hypothetical protein
MAARELVGQVWEGGTKEIIGIFKFKFCLFKNSANPLHVFIS